MPALLRSEPIQPMSVARQHTAEGGAKTPTEGLGAAAGVLDNREPDMYSIAYIFGAPTWMQ